MLTRLKFEINPLINQMLDQLPPDVWTSNSTTFLDPAMAGGQFLKVIQDRLREAGHDDTDIAERVWGCEKNKLRVKYSKRSKGLVSNHLIITEFLDYDWGDMKFDVIVGNPPYQDTMADGKRKSISTNLWTKFIDKCSGSLLADNGHLAMVVPASWAGPTKNLPNNRKILKDIFSVNNTTYISLDPGLQNMFGVGSTFSWFMMQKCPYKGSTKVELNRASHIDIDLREYESLPKSGDALAFSINRKYFTQAKTEVISGQYRTSSDQYQEKKTKEYKYPAYHTPADGGRTWYMKEKHPNLDKPKVIISLSGKYQPYPDNGKIGYTDMCLAYLLKPGETLDSAMSVFDSQLFHFIMKCNKWSGFNNKQVIRTAALPKLDKVYTDAELFDLFELTQEEADYVQQSESR